METLKIEADNGFSAVVLMEAQDNETLKVRTLGVGWLPRRTWGRDVSYNDCEKRR